MTAIWSWFTTMVRRLSFRARRSSLDDELREEMQFHIDMLARDNEARGMSSQTARETARRQFGSATMLHESSRSHWSFGWIDAIWQDVRYSIRSLVRTPGITITALITLALGIGATVAVIAVLDATLLHPIALHDVDRLVTIAQAPLTGTGEQLAPGNYISIRDAATVLEDVALLQNWSLTVSGSGGAAAAIAEGAVVTPNYFSVIGVTPLIGRVFTPADADAAIPGPTVVVLSYPFWMRHFNGNRAVIGSSVLLNGMPRTIIGVLRKDDGFPTQVDAWGPLHLAANAVSNREQINSFVVGRLKPGATAADAARDVAAVQRQLVRESPATNSDWRFVATPLREYRTADVRQSVLLVLAAVIGVLLIACANVANLLLVRAAARAREIAVRAALGAGRAQVARQLLVEGVLLSLAGGVFGLVIGAVGVRSLKHSVPGDLASYLPGWNGMGIDWYVVMLMLGICCAVGIGFSLVPAWRAARTDLTGALKQGARGSTGGRHIARMRSSLVVAEIALAVMLLACAGLLVQSFARITAARTGLQPDHVLTLKLTVPATMDVQHAAAYHQAVLQRLLKLPGVRRAAFINLLPLSNSNNGSNFIPDSRPGLSLMQAPNAHDEVITPGYFATMGIPIVRGRDFNDTDSGVDGDSAASPVIVNRTLAERYWPDGDAIGHTIRMGYEGRYRQTIVGIVGDVWYDGADDVPGPEVYHPMAGSYLVGNTDVTIQTAGDPALMEQRVIRDVAALDPSVAVTRVMTMRAMMTRHYSLYSVLANVLTIFALIALLIAAAGIYGVVSYGVAQRTQEIGIRMALGAKYHGIVRMVLTDGARVAVIGLVLGLIGSWFAGNALAFLLYGVAPRDPATLVVVAAILGAVALIASYVPARRAGMVEPVVALRYE